MDEIIKLVKTHRLKPAEDQRQRLAEEIFREVEPQLRFFVFHTLAHPAGQDVLQETLKAVTVSLTKFAGGSTQEFWAWCCRIARNKVLFAGSRKSPVRADKIPRPTGTALFTDTAQLNDFQATASRTNPMFEECYDMDTNTFYPNGPFRHKEKANVTFADGHVNSERPVPGSLDPRLLAQFIGRLRTEILTAP